MDLMEILSYLRMIGILLLVAFAIGMCIFIHELGHFLAAKLCGLHIDAFSIGFRKIWWKKINGIEYRIGILPLGGYVELPQVDATDNVPHAADGTELPRATPMQRIITAFAGPFFNFIVAFVCALIVVSFSGTDLPEIHEVMENSAAEEVGMQPGDKIVRIDGMKIHLYREVSLNSVLNMDGSPMEVTYSREGKEYDVTLYPKYDEQDQRYYMGFAGGTYIDCNLLQTFRYSLYEVQYWVRYTIKSLGMLITGKVGMDALSGPVGMAEFVGDTYEEVKPYGLSSVILTMLNLMTLLSVNLGIMNLLPLPALDGGRLVFQFVEVVRGKPVPPEKEGLVHMAGLIAFMILMVVVMYNDIMRILK